MDWLKINDDGDIELVAEEIKLVPELQAINALTYNKGKGDVDGRKRYRAKSELMYMYLAYSPRSPYKDYNEKERIEEAKLDCKFGPDWSESPELKALINRYNNSNPNKVQRLLKTTEKFIDKFENHLNNINLNERTDSGGLIHKPTDIMATLERLPRLAETLFELETQARIGVISKINARGDNEVGWMNRTNLKPNKKNGGESNQGHSEESDGEV